MTTQTVENTANANSLQTVTNRPGVWAELKEAGAAAFDSGSRLTAKTGIATARTLELTVRTAEVTMDAINAGLQLGNAELEVMQDDIENWLNEVSK